jgi:hypothetical protein
MKIYNSLYRYLFPILNQINAVPAIPTNSFKIHVDIILQSMPRSHADIEVLEKQTMIPPPTFLSQYSRVNCLSVHYEGIW